jgi:hypothetical protein
MKTMIAMGLYVDLLTPRCRFSSSIEPATFSNANKWVVAVSSGSA